MADNERTSNVAQDEKKLFFIDIYLVKDDSAKNSRPKKNHGKIGVSMVMATFWDENGLQYSIDVKDYIREYYNKPFVTDDMVSKFKEEAKSGKIRFRYNEELEILF
ncbi:MAG: hypothetical protein IKG42_04420 [Clostridia bacterium]|nr:hypothetical protein [Clostridia bacterium]